MELFHSRYELERSWTPAADGWFASAQDTKLSRTVLLWRVVVHTPQEKEEFLRRLGNAARFSHRQFVHILDVSVTEDGVYAVLTHDKGIRLTEMLRRNNWSKEELLGKLHELIPAIREARRERLQDFPVTADNIWVDGTGKLRIMNYWSEGEKERRDVCGLAMLLYQLCSRQETLPASIREYNRVIADTLGELPGGGPEDAAEWASSAFLPSCSLREYEAGLIRLLNPDNPVRAVAPVVAGQPLAPSRQRSRQRDPGTQQSPKTDQPAAPVQPSDDEDDEAAGGFRWRPWIYFSSALVLVGFLAVVALWLVIRSPGSGEDKPVTQATAAGIATDSKQAAGTPSGVSAKPATATPRSSTGASGNPISSPPAKSPASSGNGGVQPPGTASQTVPDLVNHPLEEASQLALKAGLKYQYVIEPNETAKGLVFKQDLAPGATVTKGDIITFWVSKGK